MTNLNPQRVPRQFHFVFGLKQQSEAFHLIHYLCLESCLQINKPDKIFFYYCHKPYGRYWDMISEKLELVPVEHVPEISNFNYSDLYIKKNFTYAHHSDFLRIKHLNQSGGVYADIDTLFVQELPSRLFEHSFVMAREQPIQCQTSKLIKPSVCNAFIMAEKNSFFGNQYFQKMLEAFDGTWSNHSCTLAHTLSEEFPEHIHLEPEKSFYKHSWTKEGINTLLLGQDYNYQEVYSMHLWAHLWWAKSRKDFSNFHAGKMTESFIRKVDTTYNLVARKFLPPEKSFFSFFRSK
jgi:mannosyltransferase OCH1-like enzyme